VVCYRCIRYLGTPDRRGCRVRCCLRTSRATIHTEGNDNGEGYLKSDGVKDRSGEQEEEADVTQVVKALEGTGEKCPLATRVGIEARACSTSLHDAMIKSRHV